MFSLRHDPPDPMFLMNCVDAGIVVTAVTNCPSVNATDPAKVFTGEAPWHVASPYPPVGKTAEVNFGGTVFNLHFRDNRTMSFEGTAGAFKGVKDSVEYSAVEVGRNVFMFTGMSLTRAPMLFMYRTGIQARSTPISPQKIIHSPI